MFLQGTTIAYYECLSIDSEPWGSSHSKHFMPLLTFLIIAYDKYTQPNLTSMFSTAEALSSGHWMVLLHFKCSFSQVVWNARQQHQGIQNIQPIYENSEQRKHAPSSFWETQVCRNSICSTEFPLKRLGVTRRRSSLSNSWRSLCPSSFPSTLLPSSRV